MAKIAVIGSGSYGTALTKVFSERHKVLVYSIEPAVIEDINLRHTNTRYLPSIRLNRNVTATADLNDTKDADVIIFGVPSGAVRAASTALKPFYSGQPVISTAKGLSAEGKVMTDIIRETLGCLESRVVALSGPSIASELARGKCTQVMIGGDHGTVSRLIDLLETDNLLMKATSDKRGIQILGFYKNVLAILSGISEGLAMGNNFKAALIAHAYHEFYYLNIGKNVARHTFVDVAGLGDLYVTAISKDSRNNRFGRFLAQGMSLEEIAKKIGTVIEGYENLKVMRQLKEKEFIDENLLNILHKFINERPSKEMMRRLLRQYLGASELKAIVMDWGNVLTEGEFSMKVAGILAQKTGYAADDVYRVLISNEREALMGKEPFGKFHKRVQAIYPKITYAKFLQAHKQAITYDMQMLEYCGELKKRYKLYLLSNNYSVVTPVLRKGGLTRLFDGVVFSNEVHLIKPHRNIFGHLMKKYALRPKNCLFVDDNPKNVQAAEESGMRAHRFRDLPELKAFIEKTSF